MLVSGSFGDLLKTKPPKIDPPTAKSCYQQVNKFKILSKSLQPQNSLKQGPEQTDRGHQTHLLFPYIQL